MKFYVPLILASVATTVLGLPFQPANRDHSLVRRELSASSIIFITRDELEQNLFERGSGPSQVKEALGVELSEEDKKKLAQKAQRDLQKAQDRHALRSSQIESGGKRHHKLETTWAPRAVGQYQYGAQAEKEVNEQWKKDKDLQKFKHAEITGAEVNESTGRLHTGVHFHHGDGQPGGHVVLMSEPKRN